MIIAIFLAGVCWGGYYCMKYLFDKRIKTSDELQDVYRLRILGKLEKPHEEKNKIDQKLEDLRRKMNTPPDSLSHVKSMILSLNKKNIIFIGIEKPLVGKKPKIIAQSIKLNRSPALHKIPVGKA